MSRFTRCFERVGDEVDVEIVLARIDDLTSRLKTATHSLREALEDTRKELVDDDAESV